MNSPANSRAREINTLLAELNRTLKMSVEKAIRIGQLLSEQKADMQHGEFLPWLESNFEMSQKTAWSYMKAYEHKGKLVNVTNLQEAYQQIEYIEKQEKETQRRKDDELIRKRIQTGEKPEGWNKHLEYEFKKRTDDEAYEERKQSVFENKQQESRKKKEEEDRIFKEETERINKLYEQHMTDKSDRETAKDKLKLNIRTDNINQDAIFDIINEYLNSIQDVSRKIETAQNIIKFLRNIVVAYQRRGA